MSSKILALALLLTFLLTTSVLAQGPQPPDTSSPDPIITETSSLEWMTVQTERGEERVLVPVSSIESVQMERVRLISKLQKGKDNNIQGNEIQSDLPPKKWTRR